MATIRTLKRAVFKLEVSIYKARVLLGQKTPAKRAVGPLSVKDILALSKTLLEEGEEVIHQLGVDCVGKGGKHESHLECATNLRKDAKSLHRQLKRLEV